MPKGAKHREGNEEQRRAAAREAREHGESASEAGVSTGASKQRKEATNADTHQEKLELRDHGKMPSVQRNEPRPGNRETDPEHTERYE